MKHKCSLLSKAKSAFISPILLFLFILTAWAPLFSQSDLPEASGDDLLFDCNNMPYYEYLNAQDLVAALQANTEIYVEKGIEISGFFVTVDISDKIIRLGPNAYISIEQYCTLNLKNTTIEGCDLMWGGIIMGDHATLRVEDASRINDMRYGIDPTHDDWIYFHGSGFLRNYVTFDSRNDQSFTLECFGNVIDGSGLKPFLNQQNNQIQNLGAYAPEGFHIEGAMTTHDDPLAVGKIGEVRNTFQFCGTGIWAKNAIFDIVNTRFLGINVLASGRGIHLSESMEHTIKECVFDYCFTGIFATGTYYDIENNHFNHVGTCVYATHSRQKAQMKPTISGNHVDGANDGFWLVYNDNSEPQVKNNIDIQHMGGTGIGIYDLGPAAPNRSFVAGNTLNMQGGFGSPAASAGFERGILILGTQKASVCDNNVTYDGVNLDFGMETWVSTDCIITNNDFTQTGTTPTDGSGSRAIFSDKLKLDCNYYFGNEKALQIFGPCTNTDIRTQHFEGPHKVGLQYIGGSTKQQIQAGNLWEYTPGGTDFAAQGLGIDVQANLYMIDCGDGPEICPANVDPSAWFFEQEGTGATCVHSTINCTLPPPVMVADDANPDMPMIKRIINGQLAFPSNNGCLEWTAACQALRWIALQGLQNTVPFSDYWTQKANTSERKLAEMALDAQSWEQNQATLKSHLESIWTDIDQLSAVEHPTAAAEQELKQRYQDLATARAAELGALRALTSQVRTASLALPATQIYEANQRTMNLLQCDVYEREYPECTSAELSQLRNIASQCPFEGGGAVLQARGLLELLTGERVNNPSGCMEDSERSAASPTGKDDMLIVPNPNDGQFYLQTGDGEVYQLRLFNWTGQMVWKGRTPGGQYIQTGTLSKGAYLLEIRTEQNVLIGLRKMVIQ